MKTIILYFLKDIHEYRLDDFQRSKYCENQYVQNELWDRVLKIRNKIRYLEPKILKGFD